MNEPVILCVDDQEIVLSSLKRELMSAFGAEYLIETAEDGDDALELFADLLAEGYDIPLVISDQIMPGLKGHEFLQRLHERAPDTLKIMLTGQADMDAVIHAVNSANLYRYIAKPWEHTDLVLTVKEAVEKYFQDRRVVQQHLELQQLYLQAQAELAERKRMTAMLHEREARIRAILNTAGDGILTINQGGLIQSCNPAAERIFGYAAADMSGRPIHHLIPQLDRQPQALSALAVHSEPAGISHHELNGQRQSGARFPLEITLTELRLGAQQFFIGIVRDTTERKQAEQERLKLFAIQRELTIARDIQQSLLPPPEPEWPGLEVICYNAPARDVGGDFYYYATFPTAAAAMHRPASISQWDRIYGLAIGDISGKGVSAALLVATLLPIVDAVFAVSCTPTERMYDLDRKILPYTNRRCQNCAFCYIELEHLRSPAGDADRTLLRGVNAGGIPPYLKRADGTVEIIDIGGLPLGLGVEIEFKYEEQTAMLARGDILILVSDGVVEASNEDDDMLGFEYFMDILRTAPATTARALIEYLKIRLAQFVGAAEQHDDITMIVAYIR